VPLTIEHRWQQQEDFMSGTKEHDFHTVSRTECFVYEQRSRFVDIDAMTSGDIYQPHNPTGNIPSQPSRKIKVMTYLLSNLVM